MNRNERRHPSRATEVKQLFDTICEVKKYKDIIEGDWPIKEGDKVRLNLDAITKRRGYEGTLPLYRKFCEENVGKTFTVKYENNLRQSVVCFEEDTTEPKWLFWIGDLIKV